VKSIEFLKAYLMMIKKTKTKTKNKSILKIKSSKKITPILYLKKINTVLWKIIVPFIIFSYFYPQKKVYYTEDFKNYLPLKGAYYNYLKMI
jgi:hypothetical protein